MVSYTEFYGDVRVTLRGYDSGMRKLITDPMFGPVLMKHAQEAAAKGAAMADAMPRKHPGSSARRTDKSYGQSFDTSLGYGVTIDGTARIQAQVVNTNPFAFYIEYGNNNLQSRRILRTAAGINRFDAEGDKY